MTNCDSGFTYAHLLPNNLAMEDDLRKENNLHISCPFLYNQLLIKEFYSYKK